MDPVEQDNIRTRTIKEFSTLGDIGSDLFRNSLDLIRDEIRMASAEMSQKVAQTGKNSAMLTAGGAVLYIGVFFVLVAAALGLSLVIPPAWAFLVVGAVALIVGGVLVMTGKKKLKREIIPRETMNTAKEDTKWMRNRLT